MFSKSRCSKISVGIVLLVSLFLGCASQKAMWGSEKKGFILTYRLAPETSWSYGSANKEKTSLTIMGNEMLTTANTVNNYTVSLDGSEAPNLNLSVKIDELSIKSSGPQGEQSVNTSPVVGKNFSVTATPLGKEIKFDGIENLTIDLGPQNGGEQSVQNYYRNLFPDLPEKPVKIGESWIELEDFTGPGGNMLITVKTETTHKLEGLETIDTVECLKISSQTKGTVAGQGEQDGNDLDFSGAIEGSGTWYFAYKNGAFVKMDGLSHLTGKVDVIGAYEMSIPLQQERTMSLKLK